MDPLNMLVGLRKLPHRSRLFLRSTSLAPASSLPPPVTPDRPPATVPAPDPESGLRTRVMSAPPHASYLEEGEGLLAYLTGIVSRGGKGTVGISLLGVEEYGRVSQAHILCLDGRLRGTGPLGYPGAAPRRWDTCIREYYAPPPRGKLLVYWRLEDGIRFRPRRSLHGRGQS